MKIIITYLFSNECNFWTENAFYLYYLGNEKNYITRNVIAFCSSFNHDFHMHHFIFTLYGISLIPVRNLPQKRIINIDSYQLNKYIHLFST